ncbi:DUF2062 domain-containing protein [bacterium]|nr:MAG: DUF2062 domain-containing protein [bacterium]
MNYKRIKLKKIYRYFYLRAVRIRGTPREIGLGMVIGLAVGISPVPLQMTISIILASIFRVSKLAAAAGAWFTNPLTDIPIYYTTYVIGAFVMGRDLNPTHCVQEWLKASTSFTGVSEYVTSFLGVICADIAVPLWIGGLIAAVPLSIVGYWLTYQGVVAFRLKKQQAKLQKRHEWKWDDEMGWHRAAKSPSHPEGGANG